MNLVERVVLIRELRSVADHLDAQEKLVAQIHQLRAALKACEAHMTGRGGQGCVCRCPVIDGHAAGCVVCAALKETS
jgi:hypothetical protein